MFNIAQMVIFRLLDSFRIIYRIRLKLVLLYKIV
jgi:hypothetical protein